MISELNEAIFAYTAQNVMISGLNEAISDTAQKRDDLWMK